MEMVCCCDIIDFWRETSASWVFPYVEPPTGNLFFFFLYSKLLLCRCRYYRQLRYSFSATASWPPPVFFLTKAWGRPFFATPLHALIVNPQPLYLRGNLNPSSIQTQVPCLVRGWFKVHAIQRSGVRFLVVHELRELGPHHVVVSTSIHFRRSWIVQYYDVF